MPTPITDVLGPDAKSYPIAITPDEEWLSVTEMAQWMGLCTEQVRRMCRDRRLLGWREGRAWRIPKKANAQLLTARLNAALGLCEDPGPAVFDSEPPKIPRPIKPNPPATWGRATRSHTRRPPDQQMRQR